MHNNCNPCFYQHFHVCLLYTSFISLFRLASSDSTRNPKILQKFQILKVIPWHLHFRDGAKVVWIKNLWMVCRFLQTDDFITFTCPAPCHLLLLILHWNPSCYIFKWLPLNSASLFFSCLPCCVREFLSFSFQCHLIISLFNRFSFICCESRDGARWVLTLYLKLVLLNTVQLTGMLQTVWWHKTFIHFPRSYLS